jgi:flagellar motor switch protein FliM
VSAASCQLGAARAETVAPPALDRIGTRIAHGLQDVLARLGGRHTITAEAASPALFGTWKAALPGFAAVARYRVSGWRGGMLVSFPTPLVTGLVDACYGGSGESAATRTTFSAAERRFVERLASATGDAVEAAWQDIVPLAPHYLGCTTASAEVVCGRADDEIILQRFATGSGTALEILYPAASLRALPALRDGAQDRAGDRDEADPQWRQRLSDAVMQAHLPVRTVIARPLLPLERLMSLAPGDFIPVCLPAHVPVTVAGRLLAHGTIGEANGRAAIRISKIEQGGIFQ